MTSRRKDIVRYFLQYNEGNCLRFPLPEARSLNGEDRSDIKAAVRNTQRTSFSQNFFYWFYNIRARRRIFQFCDGPFFVEKCRFYHWR